MGQRLNFEIVKSIYSSDDVLANSYYHWSGYTLAANDLANIVLKEIQNPDSTIMQIKDDKLKAIRLLELTNALITEREYPYVSTIYPNEKFNLAKSRNDGLIGVTQDVIDETRFWEEGRITIYLDELLISADCHWEYESIEHYLEDYTNKEKESVSALKLEIGDINALTVSEFKEFCDICDTASEMETCAFILNKGSVISLIG